MMIRICLLLATALVGVASGKSHSFVPRSSNNRALAIPRGGAGPLDVTDTAKVATIINGVNAGMVALSQKKTSEVYGITLEGTSSLVMKRVGTALLTLSIMAYCLVFKGTSVNEAIGWGQVPWVLDVLGDVLNGGTKDLGMPQAPQYLVGAISAATAYACLTNGPNVDAVVKLSMIWTLFNGLTVGLAPTFTCKQWGIGSPDGTTILLAKQLGWFLTGAGVLMYALTNGVDSLRAIGYSWIPLFVPIFDETFISKDFEKVGINMGPGYAWLAMMAVFVATLAFD